MKVTQLQIELLFACLLAATAFAADKPDFSGKWELVVDKSSFGSLTKPARMTLESSLSGNAMHSTQTTYTGQDSQSVEFVWYLDGKRHETDKPVPGYSVTRWDDTTLISERGSIDKAYLEVARLNLSRDGKTATEVVESKNPNGSNKEKLVWRKASR